MKTFADQAGRLWTATAREESTPRHHGRWHLIFQPADGAGPAMSMPEVRWQSRRSAERTLQTMSETELRRRLAVVRRRAQGSAVPVANSA